MQSDPEREIDFTKVIPLSLIEGDDEDESLLLKAMAEDASNYLRNHEWCKEITDSYFGLGVGGVVAVFLFKIVPAHDYVDKCVWVIVGDIPPLYIGGRDAPNPACALDAYIGAMEGWAHAAISGRFTAEGPPVAADATPENGRRLLKRLALVDKNILSRYEGDLKG